MSVAEQQIPANISGGLLITGRQRGLDARRWLAQCGLSESAVEQVEASLSYQQSIQLIEAALRDQPDLPLGIEVGTRAALTPMGMVGMAMMSCKSMREALDFGLAHHRAAGSLLDFVIEVKNGQGWLLLAERRPEPAARIFLYEEFMSSSHLLIRAMLGEAWRPRMLLWPYPQPAYVGAYRKVFDCPQQFDSDRCALMFDPALLDAPLPSYSETNRRLATQACEQLIRNLGAQDDLAAKVRSTVRAHLPQRVGADRVAQALNLSSRSLRRRLSEHGCGLRELRELEWGAWAHRKLQERGMTVARVAELMGFGDTREFRRAYKRWTGQSPRGQADKLA